MRSQVSTEVVMSILLALFLAIFLSTCVLGANAALAKGVRAVGGASGGINRGLEMMLNQSGSVVR